MIVLDTTVLVYSVGGEHPLRAPCLRLIQALGDGLRGGTTTPEVIQEFVHVRASRRSRDDAVQLGRAYRDLLSPLVQVGESELETGLRLFTEMPGLGCFDAVLASVALANSAEALVSADSAFAAVTGLTVADPSDPGFAELLGI